MAQIFLIFTILIFFSLETSLSLDQYNFPVIGFGADSLFHGDYTPPSPPPPIAPPHPPSLSCQRDLGGVGTLETVCLLNSSLTFENDDIYVEGSGNLHILPGVTLRCPIKGCLLTINVTGEFLLGRNSEIVAGTVYVSALNASFSSGSVVNATGLGGEPPAETSGTPDGVQGAGGGHGGRGASCLVDNMKLPDDVWGGDPYSWSSLEEPWSYGSKGGTTFKGENFGGDGGGRIRLEVVNEIEVNGSLLADGGDVGVKGGGGSGGSIYVKAHRM